MQQRVDDTIFAWATSMGRAGVAVMRLSGPASVLIWQQLTHHTDERPTPRLATLCTLHHPTEDRVIDEALTLYFPAPHSFTGDDVIELHCHGGVALQQLLLDILFNIQGLRLAEPGEFTKRAFLNGKIDLTQAEGLADAIDADTQAQHTQAMRHMRGDTGKFYHQLRDDILHITAHLEAYIDFPDEEIPESIVENLDKQTQSIINIISYHLEKPPIGERIRDGIEIAIIGPPNAGKSTLLNALAQRDVAIVSEEAGTTRDMIEVQMHIAGQAATLVDTAGLRASNNSIEAEGVRRAKRRAKDADLILVALPYDSDMEQISYYTDNYKNNIILCATKSDLNTDTLQWNTPTLPIACCATSENGLKELIETLEKEVVTLTSSSEAPIITRERHREALQQALSHLQQSLTPLELELRCEELRQAMHNIGCVTGRIIADDILEVVFSSFCIGK